MSPKAREDAIGIGCAFVGAALGAFVITPLTGWPEAVSVGLCVALGWGVARFVLNAMRQKHLAQRQAEADLDRESQDAAFRRNLQEYFLEDEKR